MEVHSHGLDTFGVTKETDKVYNPELKDILAPPSSQIPAQEDFTVPPPVDSSDVHVNDDVAKNVGVDSSAAPTTAFSFPPATSDLNNAPDIDFQPFDSVGVGENSEHDINQVGDQDEAFDDMVILENDMVTAANLAGGPDSFQVTDIQIDGFHQAPMSDMYMAPDVAVDATVIEVNVAEVTSEPSGVHDAEASVAVISNVTVVSTAVHKLSVTEATEVTSEGAAADFPASVDDGLAAVPTSDGGEVKVPDATNAAEMVDIAADGDTPQKSKPDGGSHEVTDEEISAMKGQKVVKKFGRKNFQGEVIDFDPETKWFKVIYEDGDDEDLELSEVKEILASARKKRPRAEGDADGSPQKTTKKPKKVGSESTAKKSRSGSKSAAKSPKTPGTKAKGSKSAKKSSASKRAKSPGKLIKRALNSSAFKTPAISEVKEGKGKGKAGTLTPKSTKGGLSKERKSGRVSRSLNMQSPKSANKGKDKAGAENSSSKRVMKSSGVKRKAAKGETSIERSKRSKKTVTEAVDDTDLVGKQVKKDFDGRLYDGVVVKFDKKNQFYKVKYADGDQEDLELHEVEAILVQDLANTDEKDDKPAKLSSLSSLMSAENASGTEKKK
ncbi:hypothetical protein GOP47_0014655 [Adiantum capillus-veneris]|uniref:PTM/DIR17-like Tudor domain-containing protein n=1 Tax=Adiantum capillus-veneris TaxID=13818 RepID=A0A9D4ZDP8_ADICA|nr:hypothetical protein GOP47_0014655 [Adiantum capillus-veneris]